MDDKSYTIRIPKKWARTALVVVATAIIVAPLTAVASHSFTDVPDSNIFHNDIEWLKDADVTRGCNPPANTLFCPTDNVTRQQMAAFMNRLANNQVVHAATAVAANHVFEARNDGFVNLASGANTTLQTLDLPAGTYLILARVDLNNNAGNTTSTAGTCVLEAGATSNTYEIPGLFAGSGPGDRYGLSAQIVHTFDSPGEAVLRCTPQGWSGNGVDPTITAISVAEATVAATASSQDSTE